MLNPVGNTALHMACYDGHVAAVRFLLKLSKRDVNLPGEHGDTPLHAALFQPDDTPPASRDFDLVKLLVEAGADLSLRDEDGVTPVEMAKRLLAMDRKARNALRCRVVASEVGSFSTVLEQWQRENEMANE